MAKSYWVTFGSGVPSSNSGLAPTFIQFWQDSGSTLAPPSIAEIGSSSGLYKFSYTPTVSIGFVLDGATTGLAANVRYVLGNLDPADRIDEYGTSLMAQGVSLTAQGVSLLAQGVSNFAFGASNFALGVSNFAFGTSIYALGVSIYALGVSNFAFGSSINSLIGTIGSTFGGTGTDPLDLFGYMKRAQDFWEGNAVFNKSAGTWDIYNRGSSYLLRTKTLSNDTVGVTKI